MRRVRVIEDEAEFPQIRKLWEELFASCVRISRACTPRFLAAPGPARSSEEQSPTVFQTYAWNEIAARIFAHRERPHVVVVESDSGAAIIPACVKRDSVSFLGEELFDYRDVLSTDDELLDDAWRELERLESPVWVKAMRGERSLGEATFFAGAPWLSARKPLPWNKKLERNLRLLREQGSELRCYRPALKPTSLKDPFHPAEAGCSPGSASVHVCADEKHGRDARAYKPFEQVVRRMYQLKGRSETGSLFTDPLRIEAVVQMGQSAESELHTIEKDAEVVAAILTFIDGDVCRFYGTYFDERWALYSPGVSLLYKVIQQAQARGLHFDFMTGEQPYKMRFAQRVVPLYILQRAAVASLAA